MNPLESLQSAADRLPYHPRTLQPNDLPIASTTSYGAVELEEALCRSNDRVAFFGNNHGLIFPMMRAAHDMNILSLPLEGPVVNTDYHVDAWPYAPYATQCHDASWQRYGVDEHLWAPQQSYNHQPAHSLAVVPDDAMNYLTDLDLTELSSLRPDILSVDLDAWKLLSPGDDVFWYELETLGKLAQRARVVIVVSSSAWNFNVTIGKPYQSIEQIQSIATTLLRSLLTSPAQR